MTVTGKDNTHAANQTTIRAFLQLDMVHKTRECIGYTMTTYLKI